MICVAAFLAVAVAAAAAQAAPSIVGVTVDGRPLPIASRPGSSSAAPEPARIPSTAGRITFEFDHGVAVESAQTQVPEADLARPVDARLRYRLDGAEAAWRDTFASGRLSLGFADSEGGLIARTETELAGESPGWNGALETAPFAAGRASAIVPPLATAVQLNLISSYVGSAIGVVGIDDVRIVVERPDGSRLEHEVPVDLGDSASLDRVPRNWKKSGTKLSMSRLEMRLRPEPHPILTIIDDEPVRYGSWLHVPQIEIAPGDRVTVTWSAAWSFGSGGNGTAEYERLKPGTYFFRVGAFYPNGEPSGVETVLPIEVYVPFHLRRDVWAGVAGLGLVGAITAGRVANVRRMKRRLAEIEREHALEQERARIARDLHDDVGAGLTEIAVQTDWLRRDVEQLHDAEISSRADRVCQSAVELIRSVDAIVWAVNPKNDTLDRFLGYLAQSADQFVRAAGLGIRLDVPDEVPATPLSGRVRHNLFLIVREAVNNAVKHAQATLVRLHVSIGNGTMTIRVEDDGQGFDPTQPADDGHHSGLANMRRRADDIGGTLALTSRPGSGTRVEITAPLA
jgi:signal transduction histidine kinase